jgi:glutathione S-transferase
MLGQSSRRELEGCSMTGGEDNEGSSKLAEPTLKLYQFPESGNSRIVRLVLAEKNLAFERININVLKGENRTPEFLKLNPRGKVPVLVHANRYGDVVVYESTVINEYLEDVFPEPPLMPATAARRARMRLLVHFYDTEVSPAAGPLILEILLKPLAARRPDVVAQQQAKTRQALAHVVEMMDSGPYLVGDGDYTLADASYTPVIATLGACGIDLDAEFPRLAAWLEAVKRRPSYKASAK